jgi:hypothetical protein
MMLCELFLEFLIRFTLVVDVVFQELGGSNNIIFKNGIGPSRRMVQQTANGHGHGSWYKSEGYYSRFYYTTTRP